LQVCRIFLEFSITRFSAARDGQKDELANIVKQEGKDVVRAKNSNEETPLHLAAGEGHQECVMTLLKYKPDLNARDRHQWTPIHSAAAGNSEVFLGYL
jgi:ankyrin repeat protein